MQIRNQKRLKPEFGDRIGGAYQSLLAKRARNRDTSLEGEEAQCRCPSNSHSSETISSPLSARFHRRAVLPRRVLRRRETGLFLGRQRRTGRRRGPRRGLRRRRGTGRTKDCRGRRGCSRHW